MTWYWWKHWFWITGLLFLTIPLILIETYPLTPIYNKEYKKEKSILKVYPLAGLTDDTEDILNDNDDDRSLPLPALMIRDNDNLIPSTKIKNIDTNNDSNHSIKISDNLKLDSLNTTKNINSNNETSSITSTISIVGVSNEDDKNLTIIQNNNESSTEIHQIETSEITKNDESKIGNTTLNNYTNSSSDNRNDNNTISTNSSVIEINLNTTQSVIDDNLKCNTTVTTINTKINNHNSTIADCDEDDTSSIEESLEDSSYNNSNNNSNYNNKTTTIHVDLVDDNHNNENDHNLDTIIIRNSNNHTNDKGSDNTEHHNTTTIFDNIMKVTKSNNKGKSHFENHTKDVNDNNNEEIIRAEIQRQFEGGERNRKSKVLAEYKHDVKYINFSSDTKNLLARSAVSVEFDEHDDDNSNVSSEALSVQKTYILDAGTISGICLSVLGLCFAITLAGITLYRRRYLNKPHTLSEPDSSGYIDDSTIRDNSDEMYSLDNDSFLNSLEAMTIQNYWTDTVKHTKL